MNNALTFASLFALIGISSTTLLVMIYPPPNAFATLSMIFFIALFAIHIYAYQRLDYFSPPFIVGLGFFWYYTSSIWYFEYFPDSTGLWLDTSHLWASACLGYAFFVLGSWPWEMKKATTTKADVFKAVLSPTSLVIAFGIMFVASRAFKVIPVRFLWDLAALFAGATITFPLLVITARGRVPTQRLYKLLWLAFSFSTLVYIMFFGSERRTVLRAIIYSATAWHYTIRKLSFRILSVLLIATLFLIYALRVEQSSRSFYQKPFFSLSLQEFLQVNKNMLDYHGEVFGVARSFDTLPGLENCAALLRLVPDRYDYLYGESYVKLIVALIPRAIWKDKPINAQNRIQAIAQTGFDSPAQPLSILGEAYWNFGWLGVCVVPFLLGWITQRMYYYRQEIDGINCPSFLYMLWIPFLLEHFRGAFHLITLTLIGSVFGVFLILIVFGRGRPTAVPSPGP